MLALTVVWLTGRRASGVGNGGVQRLDRWHAEGADIGIGFKGTVRSGGGGSEAGRPEKIGRGSGWGSEASKVRGTSGPTATGSSAEAVRPHYQCHRPNHYHDPPEAALRRPLCRDYPHWHCKAQLKILSVSWYFSNCWECSSWSGLLVVWI